MAKVTKMQQNAEYFKAMSKETPLRPYLRSGDGRLGSAPRASKNCTTRRGGVLRLQHSMSGVADCLFLPQWFTSAPIAARNRTMDRRRRFWLPNCREMGEGRKEKKEKDIRKREEKEKETSEELVGSGGSKHE